MAEPQSVKIGRARCQGHFLLRAAERGFDIGPARLHELEEFVSKMRVMFEKAALPGERCKTRYRLIVKIGGERRVTVVYDTRLSALVTIY